MTFTSDIEKVREEARQKESRYLEIISHYEEELKKYKEELNIYQRREEETKGVKENNVKKEKQLFCVVAPAAENRLIPCSR